MMLLTLRGTVFLYEGDEIGMTDVDVPRDELVDPVGIRFYPYAGRDPVRTPMQWSAEPGGGFTDPAVRPWLPFGDLTCNVADQRDDPGSFLTLTRDLIAYRHAQPDLRTGEWSALDAPAGVLAYRRGADHAVLLNLGEHEATVADVDGRIQVATRRPREGQATGGSVTLGPREGVVLSGLRRT
jgi:alpha-glucosidase